MRPILLLCTACLLTVCESSMTCGAELPVTDLEQARISEPALRKVEKRIADSIAQQELAGCVLMIVRHGHVVHLRAYGYRNAIDRDPMSTDTLCRIYSMTKPIVSVAAMTLWESGKFQLDDPVSKYIPAFHQQRVLKVDEQGQTAFDSPVRPVTVRDLFRHTSGIGYGGGMKPEWNTEYAKRGLVYTHHGMYPPAMPLADAMEKLAQVPLAHQPGRRFTYGLNVDVIGRLIEIWSGMSLDAYLRQSLFVPLAMRDTGFHVPHDRRNRLGPVHGRNTSNKLVLLSRAKTSPYLRPPQFQSGGGGLISTARDYARFCQMMLNQGVLDGNRVLRPSTIRLMYSDQLPDSIPDVRFNDTKVADGFGLGFAIQSEQLGPAGHQRTATTYRWGGYASTDFHMIPSEGLAVVFLRQFVPSSHQLFQQLVRELYSGVQPDPR